MPKTVSTRSAASRAGWLWTRRMNRWARRFVAVSAMKPPVASEIRPDRLAWVCTAVGLGLIGGLAVVLAYFSWVSGR